MMQAEIIAVGDEITSGQLLDTNSQWLSQRLEELGVRTLYHSTVGDELTPCVDVFRCAIERADVIVVTGGLGPTADDLTREALALATHRPLELDPEALEDIRAMFARRNRPMPRQNELQAMFPAGSRVVRNPHGTAPGIDLEVAREGRTSCRVICLPGVPAEMVEMWNGSVVALLDGFLGGNRRVIRRRLIHCFGAGESQIETMLPDLIQRGRRPTVGITASKATITLRIAADGATEQECFAAMEPTVATIRKCLGTLIFGEEDEQLQHAVVKRLQKTQKTLATAECGTTGLLAEWLSGVEDAADVYRGGLVFPERVESVETMAKRCREQFGADFGLAVHLPSPFGSGAECVESKTTCLALASSDGVQRQELSASWHPALSRIYSAKSALNFVRLVLLAAE
jgi:nicotinamide-nucleotide amidase